MFNNINGGARHIGSTTLGPQVASYAAIGNSQLKTINPYSRRGYVGGSFGNFESPHQGISGEVAVPTQIAPGEYWEPITLDTCDQTENTQFTLFDPKGLYRNSYCGGCDTPSASGGCVYMGADKDCGAAKYDSLVSMLCSNVYVLSSLRIFLEKCDCDGNGSSCSNLARSLSVGVWKGNLSGNAYTSNIPLGLHYNPNSYDSDLIEIPFTDDKGLIDQFTAWNITLPPDTKMTIWAIIALRG